MLRESQDYVSGQQICERFQVSRTAVWKVIKQLKEEGYEVEAVRNRGYRLSSLPDILSREEIVSQIDTVWAGQNVYYFTETDSTNIQAKRMGDQGAPHGTLAAAGQQTAGKGRRGRTWESPADQNIYMSLLLRPEIAPVKAPMLTLVMAYAAAMALRECTGLDVQIKWPNDLVINGKKICGILTEAITDFESGQIQNLILGIGINCSTNEFPKDLLEIAGALEGSFSKNELAAEVLNQLLPLIEHLEDRTFLEDYRGHSLVIGKDIQVYKGGYAGTVPGRGASALGIDENGGLIVQYDSGERETLATGEISIRL